MFSATVRVLNTPGFWCTKRIPAPNALAGLQWSAAPETLPTSMVPPGSAWYTPARILMRVDFPEPFPPTSAWISPGSTVRSTSTSARVPTKVLLRWVRRRAGTATAGPPSAPLIDAPGWAPMSGALGSRLAPGLLVRGLEVHGRYEITGGGDVVFRVGQGPTDAGV